MKQLLLILAVVAIATPLHAADIDFTATTNLDGKTAIIYTVNVGTIRGMALNIDATATLSEVTVDTYWDVFMDAAYMDPENYELGDGSPICRQDIPGSEAVDMSEFCISMGNLQGEATSNEIILSAPLGTQGTISINTLRGGIVNTDGVAMTTNLPIDFIIEPDECCPCYGDVNSDDKISIADMAAIVALLSPDYADTDPPFTADPTPQGMETADVNNDGRVSIADMSAIVAFLSPDYAETDPPYTYIGCMND